jgi:uncharacterized protein
MVRPKKIKFIDFSPEVTYFKPRGVPLSELEEVVISFEELETFRLSYLTKKNQSDAAKTMQIHQSTFQRVLDKTREKIADALVNGKSIKIEGGIYEFPSKDKINSKNSFSNVNSLKNGICICPDCGFEKPHIRGNPCSLELCNNCNTNLIRK